MTKEDVKALIENLSVKQGKVLLGDGALLRELIMFRKKPEKESCILIKEPTTDFQYIYIPDKSSQRILLLHFWQRQIDTHLEYNLVTITLPELPPEEDLYKLSKTIYFSVIESFPEEDCVIGVFHLSEFDENPHLHFLMKQKI